MKYTVVFSLSLLFSLSVLGQPWDRIIENIDTTGTINLTDPSWDNTLIRNCNIHDTGRGE